MITVCASCQRQFRINAQQLSRANGRVQCGFCGAQFNALDRLYDRPLPQTDILPQPVPEKADDGQKQTRFEVPGINVLGNKGGQSNTDEDDALALGLLVPEEKTGSRTGTVLWSLATFLLLIISVAQVAWFNRDPLLTRYPQWVPHARELCDRYQCDLVRERDLDAIMLVNRDVRDHPRYNNALLVNITIENQSDQTQPYPGIQFRLFDNSGKLTGYRRLQPPEYLDPGMAIDEGLRPQLPLHLVLEVADTIDTTVGFEFDFF